MLIRLLDTLIHTKIHKYISFLWGKFDCNEKSLTEKGKFWLEGRNYLYLKKMFFFCLSSSWLSFRSYCWFYFIFFLTICLISPSVPSKVTNHLLGNSLLSLPLSFYLEIYECYHTYSRLSVSLISVGFPFILARFLEWQHWHSPFHFL